MTRRPSPTRTPTERRLGVLPTLGAVSESPSIDRVRAALAAGIRVKQALLEECAGSIAQAADRAIATFEGGHKVLLFGNGGSPSLVIWSFSIQ